MKIKSYGNNSINIFVHRHFSGGACSKIESMTAKEKANKLLSEYLELQPIYEWTNINYSRYKNAKQCALIAVDEIVSTLESMQLIFSDRELILKFWKEVKTEIEKLWEDVKMK